MIMNKACVYGHTYFRMHSPIIQISLSYSLSICLNQNIQIMQILTFRFRSCRKNAQKFNSIQCTFLPEHDGVIGNFRLI